jgi:hypothetical protein
MGLDGAGGAPARHNEHLYGRSIAEGRPSVRVQEREDGDHAAVVGRSFSEAELEEDLADVGLDVARLRNRRSQMPRWSGLLPRASTSRSRSVSS